MKRSLLFISSLLVLSSPLVAIAESSNSSAETSSTIVDERPIEKIDETFTTNKAEYHFVLRGSTAMSNNKSIIDFWVFDFTNVSDEPIDVWFTAMNDMEAKYETDVAIMDAEEQGIYQVEWTDKMTVDSVDGSLSDMDLKPGGKISILYYIQRDYDEDSTDEYYLEFKEWFNADNTGILRPYGYEEIEE